MQYATAAEVLSTNICRGPRYVIRCGAAGVCPPGLPVACAPEQHHERIPQQINRPLWFGRAAGLRRHRAGSGSLSKWARFMVRSGEPRDLNREKTWLLVSGKAGNFAGRAIQSAGVVEPNLN